MKFLIPLVYFLTSSASGAAALEIKSNYVTFDVSKRDAEIFHNETSLDPSFSSLNKSSRINLLSLKVGFEKEFLTEEFLSFSVKAYYGRMIGKTHQEFTDANLTYTDKASGSLYGVGGSLNLNFSAYKMRIQPFGGMHIMKSSSKYRLEYRPKSVEIPKTNIDYDEEGTQSFLISGVRFYDPKTALFSLIALEMQLSSSFTTSAPVAKINNARISLDQTSTISHRPLGITVGFGIMF